MLKQITETSEEAASIPKIVDLALYRKPLNLLGLAKKAGLLAVGADSVKSAANAGKVHLIILASDVSKGTAGQARYSAADTKTFCADTPYSKFELGSMAGRGSPGVIAFLDPGLAVEFVKALAVYDGKQYGKISRELINKASKVSKTNIVRSEKQITGKRRTK